MKIVVAYKWTCDPEEATVRADGTVDWSRAKPGISAYDPVAIELARRLAEAAGAELIGVTVGAKGVGVAIASKAALSRGLDRVVIIEDESLQEAGRSELAAVLAAAVRHIGDVDLVVTGDSSVDVAAKMVPTVLAGELGWPAVAEVTAVTGQAGTLRVERADPGWHAGARDLRPRCAGRVRGCRGAAGTGHERPSRGGQEAGGAPGARGPGRAREERGHDGHGQVAPGPQGPQGPDPRHYRPSGCRCRARHRAARRRSAVTTAAG